ncbi:MAG: hypothetical protein GXY89_02455 [Tissierellia bacterium]|jgi:2-keto-3-deoxy-L-rhamnonate aldolase RhmA|nr:hypothetical protein [Tissierellia bacterium]
MKNVAKERMLNGQVALGIFGNIPSPEITKIIGKSGLDFLVIDYEHGGMNIETLGRQIDVMDSTLCTPLARVPALNEGEVKKVLDAGAFGVMFPMINTKEEAEMAISMMHYPPRGNRGFGAGRASLYAIETVEYMKFVEEGILTILQIENKEGIENIEEIFSVEGFEIAFLGPYDLSFSYGAQGDTHSIEVLDAIDLFLDACKRHNIIPGIMSNYEEMNKHIEMGFKFLIIGFDAGIFHSGIKNYIKNSKIKK